MKYRFRFVGNVREAQGLFEKHPWEQADIKFTKYCAAPSPQGNHHHRHTQAGKAAPEIVDDVKQDRLWFTDFVSFNHVM